MKAPTRWGEGRAPAQKSKFERGRGGEEGGTKIKLERGGMGGKEGEFLEKGEGWGL